MFAALRDVGVTVIVPGPRVRTSRPMPPTPATRFTSLAIGWMRNTSVTAPAGVIFQTRPTPVVPSPVQRLPFQSNAMPLVPCTPLANTVATGGVAASGVKLKILSPLLTYSLPSGPKASPLGEQAGVWGGIVPTTTSVGVAMLTR